MGNEPAIILNHIITLAMRLHGWVFIHELCGYGFEFRCSHFVYSEHILSQISIHIETSQLLVQSNCNKISSIWPGYWFKKGLILKFSNLIDSFWIKTFRVKLIKIVYPKTFRPLHIITTVTEINNLNNYVTMQTFMAITLRNGRKMNTFYSYMTTVSII